MVAFSGSGADKATGFTRYAEIPDTPWRVSFTPSQALIDTLTIKQLPLLGVLALYILAAILAAVIMLILYPRALEAEVKRVISAADRKSPLELAVPELVPIAKQLRRATLRTVRPGTTSSMDIPVPEVERLEQEGSELTNPMFQSTTMLDGDHEEVEEVLELDLAAADSPAVQSGFPEHIFRAYDIRGHAQDELDRRADPEIGSAIGSLPAKWMSRP